MRDAVQKDFEERGEGPAECRFFGHENPNSMIVRFILKEP